MAQIKRLTGHTSEETGYQVEDYPYGYKLRTTIRYWIETVKGKGDRFCSQTINPKNGRWNKPKKSTYSTFEYLLLNEDGHVKCSGAGFWDFKDFNKNLDRLRELRDEIGEVQKSNLKGELLMKIYAHLHWTRAEGEAAVNVRSAWVEAITSELKKDLFEIVIPEQPDFAEAEIKFVTTETFVIG